MTKQKENSKQNKVEEPIVSFSVSNAKKETASETNFDFDEEFKNGYAPEEAKLESIRRIREWWGK